MIVEMHVTIVMMHMIVFIDEIRIHKKRLISEYVSRFESASIL